MFVFYIICMFAIAFVWFYFQAWVARLFDAGRGETLWTFLSWLTCTAVSIPIALAGQYFLGENGVLYIILSLLYAVLAVFVFSQCVQLSFGKSILAIVASYAPFIILGVIFATVMGTQAAGGDDIDDLAAIAEDICDHGNSQKAMKHVRKYAVASSQYIMFSDDPDVVEKVEAIDAMINECSGAKFPRDESIQPRVKQSVASRKSGSSDAVAVKPAGKTISSAEAAARIRARRATSVDDPVVPAEEVKTETAQEEEQDEVQTQEPQPPGFHVFKLSEVKKYIGATVRVTRKNSDPMTGKLISYENGSVKIQQRKYGGMIDFPISKSDIEKLEVYY